MSTADTSVPIASIGTLRARFAEGVLRPSDVVEAVLARIAAEGDDHAWISLVDEAGLRARARALDERVDELEELPLYGVPFGIKDNIDLAGLPTTAGCPAFASTPAGSAAVVEALLAAGAIAIGKTNLDQLATGLSGARSPYGTPRNPIDPDLLPGGSSSGSAVAVATGTVTFALGTDTAGSGRVPAALCGVVGYKPAPGWCRTDGVVPACASFDCVSVFAGTVADAALVVEVIRNADAVTASADAGTAAALSRTALRVAIPDAVSLAPLDGAGHEAFQATVDALGSEATVTAITPIDLTAFFAAGRLLYDGPLLAERYQAVGAFVEGHPEDVLPVTRSIVLGGARYAPAEIDAARTRLEELREHTRAVWDHHDLLVVPTVPRLFTVAEMAKDPIGHNAELGPFCHFVNLLGLAAVAVPTGRDARGRPRGVTVIGPAERETRIASLAAAISTTG